MKDFPGNLVAKNPPANAGDTCSIPGPGILHVLRRNWAQGLHSYWACTLGPVLQNERSQHNEKPTHLNQRAALIHTNQRAALVHTNQRVALVHTNWRSQSTATKTRGSHKERSKHFLKEREEKQVLEKNGDIILKIFCFSTNQFLTW